MYTKYESLPSKEMLNLLSQDVKEKFFENGNLINSMMIVLEYIPRNLSKYLKKNSNLPKSRLLPICNGIGDGLSFLFKKKIVHRDIKLDNILIDNNECPIICDFGSATFLNDDYTLIMKNLSNPGGNESHLSPEVLNSFKKQKDKNKKEITIDYSKQPSFEFGVICFEILRGNHPFGDYPGYSYPIIIDSFESFIESDEDPIPNEVKDQITLLLKNDFKERPMIEEVIHHFDKKI